VMFPLVLMEWTSPDLSSGRVWRWKPSGGYYNGKFGSCRHRSCRDRSILWGHAACRSSGVGCAMLVIWELPIAAGGSYLVLPDRSPFSIAALTFSR